MVSDLDAFHAKSDEILAVPVLTLVLFSALLLENDDLIPAELAQNGGPDRGTLDERRSDLRLVAADHQDLAETDGAVRGRAENVALDVEGFPFRHAILLSSGTNDGK